MDGAIERNRVALTHIVAALFAMAATAGGGPTLPRHLWVAILRLLRPAEAAARRLIIAAARGLAVPPPRLRNLKSKLESMEPLLRSLGIAIVISPAGLPAVARRAKADGGGSLEPRRSAQRIPAFPLLDPLRPLSHEPAEWSKGRHTLARAVPRILFPGIAEPFRLPPPPSPDDAVSAAGVARRLAALAAALDDLPRQARRFARWKARLDRGLERRISPLRGGPPPGGRLARYEPLRDAAGAQIKNRSGGQNKDRAQRLRRDNREIDEILVHAHELAIDALERPDTS